MSKQIVLFIALLLLFSIEVEGSNPYMAQLDSAIAERAHVTANKEQKLAELKRTMRQLPMDEERLKVCYEVYQEYLTYRYDSALVYIQHCIHLAKELGDSACYRKATINAALLDARGGLYSESASYLQTINPEMLNQSLRYEYYNAHYWLYMNWRGYISDEKERERMFGLMERNLTLATENETTGTANFYYLKGEHLFIFDKQYDEAIQMYEQAIARLPMRCKLYASAAYAIATCYLKKGNMDDYEQWLTRAAISDMLTPLKENFALQELAMYLFEKDNSNVDRATKYIYCSMEDAQFFNDRPHIINISRKFPVILSAYTDKINHQKAYILYGMIALALLTLIVLAALFYIKKQNGQLHRRRKELQAKNEELHEQHEELKAKSHELHLQHEEVRRKNAQLEELNGRLVNTNKIREDYLRLFMDLCTIYIEKITNYKKLVQRKIKANQTADLVKVVSSLKLSEEDSAAFFRRFDKAFLELYPNFVAEFNTLLREDEQVSLNLDGSLPTELRIYALVRLGVKESSEIATLLFYSPQTIYNYRTTMKNKAINKDSFDKDVQRLSAVIG